MHLELGRDNSYGDLSAIGKIHSATDDEFIIHGLFEECFCPPSSKLSTVCPPSSQPPPMRIWCLALPNFTCQKEVLFREHHGIGSLGIQQSTQHVIFTSKAQHDTEEVSCYHYYNLWSWAYSWVCTWQSTNYQSWQRWFQESQLGNSCWKARSWCCERRVWGLCLLIPPLLIMWHDLLDFKARPRLEIEWIIS